MDNNWRCEERWMRTAWSNKEAASVDLWRRMHRVRGTRKDSGRRTRQGEWLPVKGGFFSPPPVQCVCYTSNQQLCTSETCTTSATSTPWRIKVRDNFILHSFDGSKATNVWQSIECVIQQLLLCARYPSQRSLHTTQQEQGQTGKKQNQCQSNTRQYMHSCCHTYL